MKEPTTTIDIDPARARRGTQTFCLVLFWAALIIIGALLERLPLWVVLFMLVMYALGSAGCSAAYTALTGASLSETARAFKALRGTSQKAGYIDLSPDSAPEPYAKGQRLKILKGYDYWIGPVTKSQRFASEGDIVEVRADSSKTAEVYVVTDDGAHITVPKRFLESVD